MLSVQKITRHGFSYGVFFSSWRNKRLQAMAMCSKVCACNRESTKGGGGERERKRDRERKKEGQSGAVEGEKDGN